TSGRVRTGGRIGSLLELGAGFHPDFTGRENVFLNGAIQGLRRAEIRERFDEIVAFAELEHAIDRQVRTYSSGMTMRLGFASSATTPRRSSRASRSSSGRSDGRTDRTSRRSGSRSARSRSPRAVFTFVSA